MAMLWRMILIEWKLMVRSWMFPALIAAAAGLFMLTQQINHYASDVGWYTASTLFLYMIPLFLIMQFVALSVFHRDAATKAYLLQEALPYSSGMRAAAQLIVVLVPGNVLALLPAALYAARGVAGGLSFSAMTTGLGMLVSYMVPMTFSIILACWICTWSKGRGIVIVSLFIHLLIIYFARLIMIMLLPMEQSHLFDIGLTDLYSFGFYSPSWGFQNDVGFWLHRLYYTGLTIVIFGLLLIRTARKRREKLQRKLWLPVIGIGCMASVIAIAGYIGTWQTRNDHFQQELAFYQHAPTQPLMDSDPEQLAIAARFQALIPLAYQIELNLSSNSKLSAQATIDIMNKTEEALDRFPMSLHHGFAVENVEVNGEPATFEWEPYQDVLWITPQSIARADTKLQVSLSYSGQVNDWRFIQNYSKLNAHWERSAFIDASQLYLPAHYGWYPVPGSERIAELHNYLSSSPTREQINPTILPAYPERVPADFQVTVIADERLHLMLNGKVNAKTVSEGKQTIVFTAPTVRGITLLGGNLGRWEAANGENSLAVILSDQIPPGSAQGIANNMLEHYTALAALAKTLNSDVDIPKQVSFLAKEHMPSTYERMQEPNEWQRRTYDHSGMVMLPFHIQPAAMPMAPDAHLNAFASSLALQWFIEPASAKQSLGRIDVLLGDIVSRYIYRSIPGNQENGVLFGDDARVSYKLPDPVYDAADEWYAATGHDNFVGAIQELLAFRSTYQGEYVEAENEFASYIKERAAQVK
ncbi:hypothetical protein EBB07_27660 [Paenibacillaceae bacterium]|nr:hypothetical protein EBB07_27660 [Paenibacillaceae bacterium]